MDRGLSGLHLWVRAETRATERRAPIVPDDAARLVAAGARVTVEDAPTRVVPTSAYAAAGCEVTAPGSWAAAPDDACIVGIKELPDEPRALRHTHIFFAHAFKGQEGADEVLARFAEGGGELLDVEYLTVDGRRVVAFGYWAGYVGAALGVLAARGGLTGPVTPSTRAELDAAIAPDGPPLRALVVGALGRSGRGAVDALGVAGATVTAWDLAETRDLDRSAILDHDLLVNCVVSSVPAPPFVRPEDLLDETRPLRTIADVTCDVTSEHNLLPVNRAITTWETPVHLVRAGEHPVGVIAIDNLPSLLPREASLDFSAQLTAVLADLPGRRGPWAAAAQAYAASRVPPPRRGDGHRPPLA